MELKRNEHGMYELTVPVTFVFDPKMIDDNPTAEGLREEAQMALNTIAYVDRAIIQP